MLLVTGIVLAVVVPWPWNIVALAVCTVLGCFELAFWWRRVHKLPVRTGAGTLIGAEATVLSPCHPRGEVSVNGERWQADCPAGADRDEVVRIVGRKRLLLIVEPLGRG